MNVTSTGTMMGALFDALGIDPESETDRPFVSQFGTIASLLPQPESPAHWAVVRSGPDSQLLIVGADIVVAVQRDEQGGLLASSTPSVARRVELSMATGQTLRTTSWKFWLGRSLEPLQIAGRIDGTGQPNGVEAFARTLARRAGWANAEAQGAGSGQP